MRACLSTKHYRERTSCHRFCRLPLSILDIVRADFQKSTQLFPISFLKNKDTSTASNHVTRQQKVRNALLDRVLVLAAATHQLATLHARLHQKRVQVLESLRRLVVFRNQNLGLGRLFW